MKLTPAAMSAKDKKILTIVVSVFTVVLVAVVAGVFIFLGTDKGNKVKDNVATEFKEVQVPKDSSELTRVSEAPVNKEDNPDDKHIAVDMLGNEVIPQENQDDDTSSSESRRGHSSHSHRDRSPQNNHDIRERTRKMKQVSNTGKRVKIPSVGGNFPLGAVNELSNGLIEPTNFTSIFQVRNRGVKYWETNKGTSYLVTHALDLNADRTRLSGIAPGNFLFDAIKGEIKLKKGDIMKVGSKKFRFVESHRSGKGLIARDKDIWNEKKKNRLILITCYSSSNDNIVFTFEKA